VGKLVTRGEPDHEWTMTHHKRLCDALDAVTKLSIAWARLIGGQFSPMSWYVRDDRDYSQYRPGLALGKGWDIGRDEKGRTCAQRGRTTEFGNQR
jgi:hypothetical protein